MPHGFLRARFMGRMRGQPLGGGVGVTRSGMSTLCCAEGASFADGKMTQNSSDLGKTTGCISNIDWVLSSPDDMWHVHLPDSQQAQCALPPRVRHIGQLQLCAVWLLRAFRCKGGAKKDQAHNRRTDNRMALRRSNLT